MGEWSNRVTREEAFRRARGRMKRAAQRRALARERRRKLLFVIIENYTAWFTSNGRFRPGARRKLAERFGVCPKTIARDVRGVGSELWGIGTGSYRQAKEIERECRERMERAVARAKRGLERITSQIQRG